MENMMMLSRMESTPALPISPSAPAVKPISPSIPACQETDCCMSALAMAYVPVQKWQAIYEPDVALSRGTLFAELDKPFLGEEVRRK